MTDEKAAEKPELPLAANYGVQETFRLLGGAEEISKETGHWFFERLRARGRGKLIHDNGRSMSGPCRSPKGSRASTLSAEVLRMLRQLRISAKWKGCPTRHAKRSAGRFRTGCKSNSVASKDVERAKRTLAADARAAKKRRKRACEGAPTRFGPPAEGITTRRKDHDTPRQSPSPTCRV